MESETPLARARGLGPAGEGAVHWWHERLSSVAALMLFVWLGVSLIRLPDLGYATVTEWLSLPLNATAMLLLIVTGFWHAKLGLQVVVEDYVHDQANKVILLMILNFAAVAGAALALFSVLEIALGGSSA